MVPFGDFHIFFNLNSTHGEDTQTHRHTQHIKVSVRFSPLIHPDFHPTSLSSLPSSSPITLSSSGVMVAHFTPTLYFLMASAHSTVTAQTTESRVVCVCVCVCMCVCVRACLCVCVANDKYTKPVSAVHTVHHSLKETVMHFHLKVTVGSCTYTSSQPVFPSLPLPFPSLLLPFTLLPSPSHPPSPPPPLPSPPFPHLCRW